PEAANGTDGGTTMNALTVLCLLLAAPPETWSVRVARTASESVVVLKVQRPGVKDAKMSTGFFVDEKGGIVTCRHAVTGASEIKVTMRDGTVLDGTVEAAEKSPDVAFVRVE